VVGEDVAVEEDVVVKDVTILLKEWVVLKTVVTLCMIFLTRHQISPNLKQFNQKFSNEEYQEYLMVKSSSQAQSSTLPSLSTTCIFAIHGNLGAFDHISDNTSLFYSICYPKFLIS